MAKLRRTYHARHQRRKSSNVRIFVALIILVGVMILLFRVDFADTSLVNWMTQKPVNDTVDRVDKVLVYESCVVGYSNNTNSPVWISFRAADASPQYFIPDQIVFDTAVAVDTAVKSDNLLPIFLPKKKDALLRDTIWQTWCTRFDRKLLPLMDELYGQLHNWERNRGDIRVVAGPLGSEDVQVGGNYRRIYVVLLSLDGSASQGHGFIIDEELANVPMLQRAVSIDSIEALTKLDFFADILDDKQEAEVEKNIQVLSWGYDLNVYQKRKTAYEQNQ